MPTYHARGVSVRLGVLPLHDTVTPTIVLKKGELAKRQCENAEKKLLHSQRVPEERVAFPGDERDFELHWLGGAPFMQSQAGKTLFEKESVGISANGPRRHPARNGSGSTASDLLALSLHINLSDRTFVSGLDDRNKLPLKIDVLFNGQLSGCSFLPHSDVRTGVKSLHQIFTGFRVDFLAERPWVILPPDTDPDGSPSKRKASVSVEKRWNHICEALMRESDKRGTDKQGNVSPSAEFLKALATMQMPAQVESMQEPGGKEFGVIDVVISAGDGRKVTSGAGYLKTPQRLVDTNFPLFKTSQASEKEHITPGYPASCSDVVQDLPGSGAAMSDMDMEDGESDSDYEPQPKRRALAPRVLSVYSDSFPSPEHGRTGPKDLPNLVEHDIFGTTAFGTPQSLDPFSNSSFSFARTPRIRPSPYSYHFSDPIMAENTPSAMTGLPPFENIAFLSSPVSYGPQSAHTPFPDPHTRQAIEAQSSDHSIRQTSTPAHVAADLPRMTSVISAYLPPVIPAATRLWPAPFTTFQRQRSLQPHVHVPNMIPSFTSPGHHDGTTFGGLPSVSPDRRFSMPLPPTGFFSVPTKPGSSISPSKKAQTGSQTTQEGFLLKRLVVKGKGNAIIVDRRWPNAQRIRAKSYRVDLGGTAGGSATNNIAGSSSSQETTSDQNAITEITPVEHPFRGHNSSIPSSICINKQTETSSNSNGDNSGSEHLVEPEAPCVAKIAGPTTTDHMVSLKNTNSSATDVKPAIPQRRITHNTNILGVQGPKATTFWFEDPEEILREAAKLRRSRSPIKRKKTSPNSEDAISRQAVNTQDTIPTGSSSPLSSIPSTPEPGEKTQTAPNAPSVLEAKDSIPQVDGSSDRRMSKVSPRKLVTSPKNAALKSPQRRDSRGIFASTSASAKKRKAAPTHYLPKQPRSPDRLKTISNPPLNQNCVIAFAESADKDSEQGVLRQVRSERQGMFAEQYVVFATRFFIPGN